jgi:hypothetical protein
MVSLGQIQTFMQKQAEEDKNRQFVNVSGDSLQDALKQAAIELNRPIKKIEYEILERGNRGMFGMGKKPCLIVAYPLREVVAGEDGGAEEDIHTLEDKDVADRHDGRAVVRLSPEGVMLKVTKPVGGGAKVTERQAIDRLAERTRSKIETGKVARVVKAAAGEFVKVGDFEYDPAEDAALTVSITDQEMKAYLTMLPPGEHGADPDPRAVVSFLRANDVVEGIKEDVLQAVCDDPQYREPILIAEGRRPVNGEDAKILYNFETDTHNVRLKETDGRVDFKELNLVQNVVQGQVLAKKVPPKRGVGGSTVTGKLLPAKDGSDVNIQVGKNVRLSDDRNTAIAEINGQVMISAGKVIVEPIYVVPGDVSLKTGNILFLGTVIIKGSVSDGFSVKASGNIEVHGSVGKCELDAEGDVLVHQGITGKNTGSVKAGGDIYSKFIENARVEAGGLVVVSDGIINSEVFSDHKVLCRGKRASIVGGSVRAAEEINAKTFGSVAGMETRLEVGYDPKSKEHLAELDEEREELRRQLDEVNLNMATLKNLVKQRKKLSKERVESFKATKKKKAELDNRLAEIAEESRTIQDYLSQLKVSGRICASGTVYPGVKVHIKDAPLDVRNEFKAVTFVLENNIVKITKYEEPDEDVTTARSRG